MHHYCYHHHHHHLITKTSLTELGTSQSLCPGPSKRRKASLAAWRLEGGTWLVDLSAVMVPFQATWYLQSADLPSSPSLQSTSSNASSTYTTLTNYIGTQRTSMDPESQIRCRIFRFFFFDRIAKQALQWTLQGRRDRRRPCSVRLFSRPRSEADETPWNTWKRAVGKEMWRKFLGYSWSKMKATA